MNCIAIFFRISLIETAQWLNRSEYGFPGALSKNKVDDLSMGKALFCMSATNEAGSGITCAHRGVKWVSPTAASFTIVQTTHLQETDLAGWLWSCFSGSAAYAAIPSAALHMHDIKAEF